MSLLSFFLFVVAAGSSPQAAAPHRVSTVGVPVSLPELVLPGSRLEVKPSDLTTPVAVRIADVYPHGTSFRYDIEAYGLEPGTYDLRDYLRRVDGSPVDDLPRIPLTVHSVLPPGRVQPGAPPPGETPALGGYRAWLWVGGILWLAGAWAILRLGRKPTEEDADATLRPATLADRLRPLVERGVAGELTTRERAELELVLIAFWRRKLGLENREAAQALLELKRHPEAGPLIVQLEEWLHRPAPHAEVDVVALLAPYGDLPADALDALADVPARPARPAGETVPR